MLLWKTGFAVPAYPSDVPRFFSRADLLRKAIDDDGTTEDELRSRASNFFVSLEDVLDLALSFITWALWSDHLRETGFEYRAEDAREFAAAFLNQRIRLVNEAGDPITFHSDGRNTLWPLVEGFAGIGQHTEDALGRDAAFRRPIEDLPGYADKARVLEFPFRHSALVFDLAVPDVIALTAHLRSTTALARAAEFSGVRNRVGHGNRDFPSRAELGAVVDAATSAVEAMSQLGSVPTVRYRIGSTVDRYRRVIERWADSSGRTIDLPFVPFLPPWPSGVDPVASFQVSVWQGVSSLFGLGLALHRSSLLCGRVTRGLPLSPHTTPRCRGSLKVIRWSPLKFLQIW